MLLRSTCNNTKSKFNGNLWGKNIKQPGCDVNTWHGCYGGVRISLQCIQCARGKSLLFWQSRIRVAWSLWYSRFSAETERVRVVPPLYKYFINLKTLELGVALPRCPPAYAPGGNRTVLWLQATDQCRNSWLRNSWFSLILGTRW